MFNVKCYCKGFLAPQSSQNLEGIHKNGKRIKLEDKEGRNKLMIVKKYRYKELYLASNDLLAFSLKCTAKNYPQNISKPNIR